MRCVTYAGETVLTTDDVAAALVVLTAAIARDGEAEAVSIPILVEETGDVGTADLVIGVGNDVLSAPTEWNDEEPDFSDAAAALREHHKFPRRYEESDESAPSASGDGWDYDFDGL